MLKYVLHLASWIVCEPLLGPVLFLVSCPLHWNPDEKEVSPFDYNSLQLGRKGVWTFSLWRDKLNKRTDEASLKCVEGDKELQTSRMLSYNSLDLSVPFLVAGIYIEWANSDRRIKEREIMYVSLQHVNKYRVYLWNAVEVHQMQSTARPCETRWVGKCDAAWDGTSWWCGVTARRCASLQHLSPKDKTEFTAAGHEDMGDYTHTAKHVSHTRTVQYVGTE